MRLLRKELDDKHKEAKNQENIPRRGNSQQQSWESAWISQEVAGRLVRHRQDEDVQDWTRGDTASEPFVFVVVIFQVYLEATGGQ